MNIKQLKELRAQAHSMEPILQIGKDGINDSIIKEILRQLKKKKLIKIRLLPSAGERSELVNKIVSGTKAVLVRSVGRVVVLYKSPK